MENKLKGRKVFVTTLAFSGNNYLCEKLISTGAIVKFNDTGRRLSPEELLHGLNSSDYAIIGLYNINTSNIANIINQLRWKPSVDFEQGLKITIQWYLNNKNWLSNIADGSYMNLKKVSMAII